MMHVWHKLTLLLVMLATSLPALEIVGATAEPPPDFAAAASAAYDRGDFDAAAQAYESALASGITNGHLYYNLGITEHRRGRLGDSVAALLAARRFLPRDPDVAANLRYALSRIADRLEAEPPRGLATAVSFWASAFTVRELAYLTAVLLGVAGLVLGAGQLRRAPPWLRPAGLYALALPVLAGIGLTLKLTTDEVWGAVRIAEAKVYSGPGDKNTVVFALREGAPVLVHDAAVSGWRRIELSDGKKGWIAGTDLKVWAGD